MRERLDRIAQRPVRGELRQKQMHPHRYAVAALGDQLPQRRRGERLRHVGTIARATITLPANPTSMGTHLDLDDLGVFRLADLGGRHATPRTCHFVGRQLGEFLNDRQVRVVASPGSGRARLMTAWSRGGLFRIVQAIRPSLRPFLFRLGREELVFELSVLGAKRIDFLLQLLVFPFRLLEHPLPVARLLTQFGNLVPQLSHFPKQPLDQSRKLRFPPGRANRLIGNLKQRDAHGSHAIPKIPKPLQISSRPKYPTQDGLGECLLTRKAELSPTRRNNTSNQS